MKSFAIRNPVAAGVLVIVTYALGLLFAWAVLFANLILEGIKTWVF